ncbi:hypothetical protein BBF96_09310 [Anoxybacter fermentans]|uniref:Prepilin-type N-terminal cleavage/methylation domain-containing protein n=1 Tax=Anoxybacter fermentans TaxID=1323375 RepID=A0A3Q9HSM0_9FIRM|nr:hypothetical protein BBF96_09310 [Anoxybacter fermentans]
MLHTGVGFKNKDRFYPGFTILEVLLVVSLSGLLFSGFLSFFIASVQLFHSIGYRSEISHQIRMGIEFLISDLEDADPQTITLIEETDVPFTYTQIMFSKYGSSDLYWFYINSSKNLIRARKRPGKNWGRTTIASGIEYLYLISTDPKLIQIEMGSEVAGTTVNLKTSVSPGFSWE